MFPPFLLDGEFHYFRINKSLWKAGLSKLKDAGLNSISTYVPWIYHEPQEGKFDFEGLIEFIELCRESNLRLMVRPGPFIYAEYKGFGIPLWVGENYPECVVEKADGRKHRGDFWYNYSHADPVFRGLVKIWYKNLIDRILPYFGNPIISFQLDGETGLLYVNELHNFLRRPFDYEAAINWQMSMEKSVCEYLMWLRDTARHLGVTVPLVHNDSAMHYSPAQPAAKARIVDLHGYDFYNKVSGGKWTCDFPFGNSIYPEIFKNFSKGRPLYVFELGMGWFDPRSNVKDEALLQNAMGAVARGAKGLCLYIAHDCVEENGQAYEYRTMLDKGGAQTPRYGLVQEITKFVKENESEILNSGEIYDEIAFAYYYPDYRFAPDDYLPGQFLIDPLKYLSKLGRFGFYALLLVSGYNPRIIDIESAGPDELSKFKALVFPGKGYADKDIEEKLRAFTANGGRLIRNEELAAFALPRPLDRLRVSASIFRNWLVKYKLLERRKVAKKHRTSMHVIDLFEPVLSAISAPCGFPAARYFTPGYYSIPARQRKKYREFAISLMNKSGIKRRFATDMEIEVVERKTQGGSILFLFNRLGPQKGILDLNRKITTLERLYSHKNSCAGGSGDGKIELTIESDDVLVLRI